MLDGPYGIELAWITCEVGKYPDEIEVEVGAADKNVNGDAWWAAWIRDWSGYRAAAAVDSCLIPEVAATGYGAYLGLKKNHVLVLGTLDHG